MVARYIVEKYEKHRYETGRKDNQKRWEAWYERQQAALRAGRPFDEPPPGYDPENNNHSGESS